MVEGRGGGCGDEYLYVFLAGRVLDAFSNTSNIKKQNRIVSVCTMTHHVMCHVMCHVMSCDVSCDVV